MRMQVTVQQLQLRQQGQLQQQQQEMQPHMLAPWMAAMQPLPQLALVLLEQQ
jgi:hypothetical protein